MLGNFYSVPKVFTEYLSLTFITEEVTQSWQKQIRPIHTKQFTTGECAIEFQRVVRTSDSRHPGNEMNRNMASPEGPPFYPSGSDP